MASTLSSSNLTVSCRTCCSFPLRPNSCFRSSLGPGKHCFLNYSTYFLWSFSQNRSAARDLSKRSCPADAEGTFISHQAFAGGTHLLPVVVHLPLAVPLPLAVAVPHLFSLLFFFLFLLFLHLLLLYLCLCCRSQRRDLSWTVRGRCYLRVNKDGPGFYVKRM